MTEINLITRRRAEIESELSRLQSHIQDLQAELRDLLVAERVLARLSGESGGTASESVEQPTARAGSTKPDGTPSMPAMIFSVLRDARDEGLRGLEPKDMTARIAKLWWPGVRPESSNSIAWRMWKRGQLEKDGAVYMLPQTKEATDDDREHGTSVASEQGSIF